MASVDHAGDAPAEFRLGHDDFEGVGGGAEDAAHLRHLLQRVQDVDRVAVLQEHEERVSRADRDGVAGGQLDETVVVAGAAHEARTRGLAERDTEPEVRAHSDQGLVHVLDGLDEVGLSDDHVHVVGFVDRHDLQIHDGLLGCLSVCPASARRTTTERAFDFGDPRTTVGRAGLEPATNGL